MVKAVFCDKMIWIWWILGHFGQVLGMARGSGGTVPNPVSLCSEAKHTMLNAIEGRRGSKDCISHANGLIKI